MIKRIGTIEMGAAHGVSGCGDPLLRVYRRYRVGGAIDCSITHCRKCGNIAILSYAGVNDISSANGTKKRLQGAASEATNIRIAIILPYFCIYFETALAPLRRDRSAPAVK
jgi:hypothetical protein